jgi:hypothetical protein
MDNQPDFPALKIIRLYLWLDLPFSTRVTNRQLQAQENIFLSSFKSCEDPAKGHKEAEKRSADRRSSIHV